jgi:hypothetical protein
VVKASDGKPTTWDKQNNNNNYYNHNSTTTKDGRLACSDGKLTTTDCTAPRLRVSITIKSLTSKWLERFGL